MKMNIVEINFCDLTGRIFNGYDLMHDLNKHESFSVSQIVSQKLSRDEEVFSLRDFPLKKRIIQNVEQRISLPNTLSGNGNVIMSMPAYQQADIIHCHILHNGLVSIMDYSGLFNGKTSVWTIHDPWVVTGGCVYPLECRQWENGCHKCPSDSDFRYHTQNDNCNLLWKIKRDSLKQINPYIIVSTQFMKNYLAKSPLTNHFDKIKVVTFGVKTNRFHPELRNSRKIKFGLDENKITIGCRVGGAIKGSDYLFRALDRMDVSNHVELVTVGERIDRAEFKSHMRVLELDWLNDADEMASFYEACDIFAMPSLAESFGLMAIEAMAAECTVLCFRNTTVEELIEAPSCGIAVEYRSEQALAKEISKLLQSPEEIRKRGKIGRRIVEEKYRFEDYVERHKGIYEEIYAQSNFDI